MKKTDRPIANPVAVLREEFDDWAVLFDPDSASAVGINPVGVAIWKQLNGKRDVEEICSVIRDSFEVTPDTVHEEIVSFLDALIERGFVGLELKRGS